MLQLGGFVCTASEGREQHGGCRGALHLFLEHDLGLSVRVWYQQIYRSLFFAEARVEAGIKVVGLS